MKMRILEISLFIVYGLTLTAAMNVVYMDQWCGQTKYIRGYAAIRVKLTNSAQYNTHMDCIFTVEGTYKGENRLMIQFQWLSIDFDVESKCDNDWLTLYDGSIRSSSTIGRYKFCGVNTPEPVYTTSGNALTFYFKSNTSVWRTASLGFDIILTHFETGICDLWEVNCDNGRCIDDSLRCNGYNPCGDESDCTLSTGEIAGIAVGSILFVAIVVAIVIVVVRRRRRRFLYQRPVLSTVQTTMVARHQGYNQPVPQQFQTPTVPGVYAAQTKTTYPPPPPYAY